MIISIAQALDYAHRAGFNQTQAITAVAIAIAESGLNTAAVNPHDPGGSYGLWQINHGAHPNYDVPSLSDPQYNANAAYQVSNGGVNFLPWTTYKTGAYSKYVASVSAAAGTPTTVAVTGTKQGVKPVLIWDINKARALWPWLVKSDGSLNINNPWHSSFESSRGAIQDGVGIGVGLDTTITSLTSGTVVAAGFGYQGPNGYANFGGWLIVKSNTRTNGKADVFYRHMDTLTVKQGDSVTVGQALGLSGGQTVGGQHPESSTYTTGAHIDIGLNPLTLPYHEVNPNTNPMPYLNDLVKNGPPTSDQLANVGAIAASVFAQTTNTTNGTGPVADNFAAIAAELDNIETFVPFNPPQGIDLNPFDWGTSLVNYLTQNTEAALVRLMFIVIGLIIVLAFIINLIRTPLEKAVEIAGAGAAIGAIA